MIEVKFVNIKEDDLKKELFKDFIRHQEVTKCWRQIDGQWCIKDIKFTEEWREEEFELLAQCLSNTVKTGGIVFGAFVNEKLKGFVSIEANLLGKNREYLDLSSIHVSEDMRGNSIGKQLFLKGKRWAKDNGAKKLYISAHSSVESQAFYRAMGCVEAKEYNKEHVEKEPCDCQLECLV